MNCNVHFHSLVLEGVYTGSSSQAAPLFHPLPPPTDEEIPKLLEQVHHRVQKLLRRRGRLPKAPRPSDPVAEPMPLLAGYAAAAIQELLATGSRAGHPVRRLRYNDETLYGLTDPRITAVIASVPMATPIDMGSMAHPDAAVGLIEAGQDRWLVPRFHIEVVRAACAWCEPGA